MLNDPTEFARKGCIRPMPLMLADLGFFGLFEEILPCSELLQVYAYSDPNFE
jgi:hypothetical protein